MRNYYWVLESHPLVNGPDPTRQKNVPNVTELLVWQDKHKKVLKNGTPFKVGDTLVGGVNVSTVFLGINHSFHDRGPEIVWETMLFNVDGQSIYDYQERYTTYKEAVFGHREAIRYVRNQFPELAACDDLVTRFDRNCRSETIKGVLSGILKEGNWFDLPILADALQDAGCEMTKFLAELRTPLYNLDIFAKLYDLENLQ